MEVKCIATLMEVGQLESSFYTDVSLIQSYYRKLHCTLHVYGTVYYGIGTCTCVYRSVAHCRTERKSETHSTHIHVHLHTRHRPWNHARFDTTVSYMEPADDAGLLCR